MMGELQDRCTTLSHNVRMLTEFLARITPACSDITRLVSESMDRTLPVSTRIKLRLHLMICTACAEYRRQLQQIRQAMRNSATKPQEQDPNAPSLSPTAIVRLKKALRAKTE